jgi:hypothetical protein
MPRADVITNPDDPKLDVLCQELAARTAAIDQSGEWPAEQLELCGRFGVYQWFLPGEWGGQDWSELDIVRGYQRRLPHDDVHHHAAQRRLPAPGRVSASFRQVPTAARAG